MSLYLKINDGAVSYTHLDVYKRQCPRFEEEKCPGFEAEKEMCIRDRLRPFLPLALENSLIYALAQMILYP